MNIAGAGADEGIAVITWRESVRGCVPRNKGGLVDAEDHAQGLQVAFLLALLARPAREHGRVVDESRGQVAQCAGRVVGREGGVAKAVDLLLDDAEDA